MDFLCQSFWRASSSDESLLLLWQRLSDKDAHTQHTNLVGAARHGTATAFLFKTNTTICIHAWVLMRTADCCKQAMSVSNRFPCRSTTYLDCSRSCWRVEQQPSRNEKSCRTVDSSCLCTPKTPFFWDAASCVPSVKPLRWSNTAQESRLLVSARTPFLLHFEE